MWCNNASFGYVLILLRERVCFSGCRWISCQETRPRAGSIVRGVRPDKGKHDGYTRRCPKIGGTIFQGASYSKNYLGDGPLIWKNYHLHVGKDQAYTSFAAWSEKAAGCLVTVSGSGFWGEGYRGEQRANKPYLLNSIESVECLHPWLGIEVLLLFATILIAPLHRISAALPLESQIPSHS